MEESIKYLKDQFGLPDVDIRTYSPTVLAYIGDGIYELLIRTILVDMGNRQANMLHKKASGYVRASAQCAMILALQEELTEEELQTMRLHPLYSDKLLGSKFGERVRLAARHHHEKLNGKGYPDGIQGDELDLCTRVTAISDIYDAMVSARSYKGARLPLHVLDMFYKEEFDGLDRGLVMRFLKNMRLKYTNRSVIMSNGETGIIRYIPPNDAGHPIVQQEELVRQADENWYCREMVAVY